MTRVTVKIPTQLHAATDGIGEASVPGDTVGAVLSALGKVYPVLIERIGEPDGSTYGFEVRRYVNIYVGGEDIHYQNGLETPLDDGDEITILPAGAGG